jgi:hypothetical protein
MDRSMSITLTGAARLPAAATQLGQDLVRSGAPQETARSHHPHNWTNSWPDAVRSRGQVKDFLREVSPDKAP